MELQMRRILRRLYPSRTGDRRHREDAPNQRFFGRLINRKLERTGTRSKRITMPRLVFSASLICAALVAWGILYYYNKFITPVSILSR